MNFHRLDLPTIVCFALLSLLPTWLISSVLENREERKREVKRRKALERLESPYLKSPRDDSE